jgi:hypothetical protein
MTTVIISTTRWNQIKKDPELYLQGSGKLASMNYTVKKTNTDDFAITWNESLTVVSPVYESMTKEKIEQYMIDTHDVNVNTRSMTKKQMVAKAKELDNGL